MTRAPSMDLEQTFGTSPGPTDRFPKSGLDII